MDMVVDTRPSVSTRLTQWWADFPLVCRATFACCVSIFLLQNFGLVPVQACCFNPSAISFRQWWQVYRTFTSPYLHGSPLHLVFNMLALVSLGPPLERRLDTRGFVYLTCFSHVFVAFMSGIVPVALGVVGIHTGFFPYRSCAIGYSGALFTYLTILSHQDDASQSLFGLIRVPSKFYPWVLLIVIQLLVPSSSLSGHAFGIIAGYLALAHRENRLSLPKPDLTSLLPTRAPVNTPFPGSGRVLNTGLPPEIV
eukprot:TRINITY_DN3263_c0_g1_i1.p1 TRINITY_DN3263_c0_g1~~TRINITY_DN3263_c0_g1_i1.p1  ORF type:complete len:261 (-),score=10.59 TRINITY_DN3263_c0_g1_i1:63-821(-)